MSQPCTVQNLQGFDVLLLLSVLGTCGVAVATMFVKAYESALRIRAMRLEELDRRVRDGR